ncbi:MAG: S26 family signal peptidase, partial [Fulvivirga sp.]
MNWKFWEKKEKPEVKKSKAREWLDAITFAVIAATLIRWLIMEAFTIPTPSMEKSLLVGDFLFVSK